MGVNMENIIIEQDKTKAFLLMTAEFLVFILFVNLWLLGMGRKNLLWGILGFFFTLGFGIWFLILLFRALERKPLLTITFDGIIDNSSAGSAIYIAFQDIERFCIVSLHGKQVIGVIPKDETSFVSNLSAMKQAVARTNSVMNCPPFFIRTDRARDMSSEDILTLMKKRLEDYSCLYD